jgi:hypothetical protein
VTGQVSLTTAFTTTTGQTEAALDSLAQKLATESGLLLAAPSAGQFSGQQAAGQVLAASLVESSASLTSDTGLTSSSSQDILNGFSQGGFISVDSGAPAAAPAQLAVLVTPGGPPPQSAAQVLVAFAQELKSAGSATVMAGATTSIGAGSVISAEDGAGPVVTTVDNADTETGQIVVVQALRELLDGKSPQAYGDVPQTAVDPAPTPAATPTVRAGTSPTSKSH